MRIRIIAVGTKMPPWVDEAVQEYCRRFPSQWQVRFIETALGHRPKKAQQAQAMAQEGDSMLAQLDGREHVVALDVKGSTWSTQGLAEQMRHWQEEKGQVTLLVGGPDGLDARCLSRANQRWSLSPLTLPHPLVRVLLAEQLYRGWSILNHHPYHK